MQNHKPTLRGSLATILGTALATALAAGCMGGSPPGSAGVDAAAGAPFGDDLSLPGGLLPGHSPYAHVDDVAGVKVQVLTTAHPGGDSLDHKRLVQLVRSQFALDAASSPYYKVDVRVIYDADGNPHYLVVYMRHRTSYRLDVARVLLSGNYDVVAVEHDYVQTEWDLTQDPAYLQKSTCPDPNVQMLFATETTEFSTAVDGIERAAQYAQAAGFNTVSLFGWDATPTAYKNYLACEGLLVLGNIGHGAPDGIMLAGGSLSYSYFNSLAADALAPMILYFNSCDVHQSPLEPSILGAGASRFIGGDIPLEVGPSEATFKCFWQEAVASFDPVEPILTTCEQQNYWPTGAHGISGTGPLPWGIDGAACEDGSFCESGYCIDGVCCATACDQTCMACNVPGSLGVCMPALDSTPCPDGDRCNGDETCQGGSCQAGSPPDCSTDNPCTNDYCDALEGCKHDPVEAGTPCPDDDLCNGQESCLDGVCRTASEPTQCNDLNECTVDSCDPTQGCQYQSVADNTECGGGLCGVAACQGGLCVPQDNAQCDDGDPCTGDSCHPDVGCVNPVAPDGEVCGLCRMCVQGECSKEPGCTVMGVMACNVSGSLRGGGGTSGFLGLVLLTLLALPAFRRRRRAG